MNQITLIIASSYGALAILLGAFGAHALKKILNNEQLKSFESGVKYQMYHSITLLILGINLNFETKIDTLIVLCFSLGTFLFSFSIYGLVFSAAKNKKIKILGPITPLGGLLLFLGWCLLIYHYTFLL